MAVHRFLTQTSSHLNIEAPVFIWRAAVGLVLFTLAVLFWFAWIVGRDSRLYGQLAAKVRALKNANPVGALQGLPLHAFDELRRVLEACAPLRHASELFLAQRILRRNAQGEDEIWMARGAEEAFSEDLTIDARINRAFFSSVPGIVTGAGLLFTFIAILVALLEVRLTGNQVAGLDLLIKGLSGKFISSIFALSSATVYLLFEKPLLHRLGRSRQDLVASLNALVPVLSSSQLLADLLRDIGEQSTAFRSFNADLSLKLKQSFSESMGPTLSRMVEAIEELNQLMRAAEAQKQESITGTVERLLDKLESSVTRSLREITDRFTESISTGARTEFASVIESLRGAATLLEKMNVQFASTQQAVQELAELSKRAAAEQIQLGRTQIEELSEVLRSLMTQLNETAGSSVSQMAATLTSVVHDLSARVTELGDKMTNSIVDSAGLATSAANEVIEKANQWSAKSSQQLAELLDTYHGQIDTVKELRANLEQSLAGFRAALHEYGTINGDLKSLVQNASAAGTSASGAAEALRDAHESIERLCCKEPPVLLVG
jgi:hypothetical protein